jgi:ABC-type transport system involved in multi-copper enzyme maturation permease subunit
MLRVVDAELRRMVRRWSYWVLTAVVITVVGVLAWYNVASLRSARNIYQQAVATAERCERDGGAACPQLGQVTASSYGVGLSDATSGTSQQAQPTQPLTVDEVLQQSINDADRNLEVTLSAMSPGNWPRLSLAALATAPGAFLAVVLGAIVVGGDYGFGTWKTQLLAGVSRRKLLAGRAAALAIALAGWVGATYILSPVIYALVGRGVVTMKGWPPISVESLLGAWLALSVFACVGVVMSILTRSSVGGLVGSAVFVVALVALGVLSNTHLLIVPGSSAPTTLPHLHAPVGLALLAAADKLVAPAIAVAERTPIVSGLGAAGPSMSALTATTILAAWLLVLFVVTVGVFDRQEIR